MSFLGGAVYKCAALFNFLLLCAACLLRVAPFLFTEFVNQERDDCQNNGTDEDKEDIAGN